MLPAWSHPVGKPRSLLKTTMVFGPRRRDILFPIRASQNLRSSCRWRSCTTFQLGDVRMSHCLFYPILSFLLFRLQKDLDNFWADGSRNESFSSAEATRTIPANYLACFLPRVLVSTNFRTDKYIQSMAISGTDWLEVPTISKAYVKPKGISPQKMALDDTHVPPL